MVISAGGSFVRKGGGEALEYQGGETRLVSLPAMARFQDLVDSLDRVAGGSITSASSIGLGQARNLLLLPERFPADAPLCCACTSASSPLEGRGCRRTYFSSPWFDFVGSQSTFQVV